jgi:hypothetical protein
MSKRINVLGKNNFVDSSANNVTIIGDGNKVQGKVNNVFIVGNNQVVNQSNTVVIDGDIKRFNKAYAGNRVAVTSASTNTVDPNTTYYLADTTSNNVTFNLVQKQKDYFPGKEFNFKKLAAANKVFINATPFTIDGSTVVQINSRYTNVTIMFDGYQYNIV